MKFTSFKHGKVKTKYLNIKAMEMKKVQILCKKQNLSTKKNKINQKNKIQA